MHEPPANCNVEVAGVGLLRACVVACEAMQTGVGQIAAHSLQLFWVVGGGVASERRVCRRGRLSDEVNEAIMEKHPGIEARQRIELQPSVVRRKSRAGKLSFNAVLLKRSLDFVASGLGLVCLCPVLSVTALLIKLDSAGPVFYTQMRIGEERRWRRRRREELDVKAELRKGDRRNVLSYGRLFRIYKFRTMVRDAEDLTGPTWATPEDPRVTRVGRVLRLLRIDELPQLWNVFKGEMSLVGPRPERPHFVHKFADKIPEYTDRLGVRPGITGLAQVSTLDEITEEEIEKKLFLDLRYVRDLRFISDFKILLKTVVVILKKVSAGKD